MEPEKNTGTALTHKNLDPISFFEKDSDFVFVFKKTEKLTSAVYLVTNLLSESEPLKWVLRKKATDLMSFIIGYKNINESTRDNFVYNAKTRILEIVSFLEISLNSGLVSNMNFSILKYEFSNLINLFTPFTTVSKEPFLNPIPETFFDTSSRESNLKDINSSISHGFSKSQGSFHKMSFNNIKDIVSFKGKDDLKKSNRQNIILNLLKKKKELTIKDISQVIKDCSEKTIQRELISFIKSGVLKRTGERRWSRYSLAN